MDGQDEDFGQRAPPLIKLIKDILDKYPEGGQIIKELIQNADDARATEVKLLLDTSQHGTDTLLRPSLADYQGAALYCYNDGVFTPEDWEGIQAVQQSVKKDDPMRVGRFGLGFVSVYHITDLPTIMSADKIAFLDPFERHFRDSNTRTGKAIRLDHKIMTRYKDQFSPFTNVLGIGEEHFANSYFDGTLFRFPLRQTPSPELSSTVFTPERVKELYQSFQEDGDVVLLFLNHVRQVSLYERTRSGEEKLIFEVTKTEEDMDSKREFLGDLESKVNPLPYVNNRSIVTSVLEGQMIKSMKRNWLVLNNVFDVSGRLKELAEELKLLPWIGLAMAREEKVLQNINGRIFCFLPLPPSKESTTGLPIHVHGYFGLSDNRRSLKWPAADQKHDHTAEWNQCLVEELLPKAYSMLIVHAVQQSISPDDVYNAWPTIENLEPHWGDFIPVFVNEVLKEEVFFTNARGGKWISLQNALLDVLIEEHHCPYDQYRSVINYFIHCGQPVVTVPENVRECILKSGRNLKKVSPSLLRECVRHFEVKTCTTLMKTHLLEYCLHDENFHDLKEVPLLPVRQNKFIKFSTETNIPPVLLPPSRHPEILIPGDSKFFHFISSKLPASLDEKLKAIAANKICQVRDMTENDVIRFLPEMFPQEWLRTTSAVFEWTPGLQGHPTEDWLLVFWTWLQEKFPKSIEMFRDLPIIPIHTFHSPSIARKQLLKLNCSIPAIFANTLEADVRECLRNIGVVLLSSDVQYLHHSELGRYIQKPTPEGVMKVLMKIHYPRLAQLQRASAKQLCSLRHVLGQLNTHSISSDNKDVLCQLPIFEVVAESGNGLGTLTNLGSKWERKPVASLRMTSQFPNGIRFRKVFVKGDDIDSQCLLAILGAKHMKLSEVFTLHVLPDIKTRFYESKEIDAVMVWVLSRYQTLVAEDTRFADSIKHLPFIKKTDSSRVAPNVVFDPAKKALKDLFQGEDVFPTYPYNDTGILMVLRQIGLRQAADVTSGDLLKTATALRNTATGGNANVGKARALLDFINTHTSLLSHIVEGKPLVQHLNHMEWIPRLCNKPENYPIIAPWYEDAKQLYRPCDVFPLAHAYLVGAVKPVFQCNLSEDLTIHFDNNPSLKILLRQLDAIVSAWRKGGWVADRAHANHIEEMVTILYSRLDSVKQQSASGTQNEIEKLMSGGHFPWIWIGNDFKCPREIAININFAFDVKPHLFELPQHLLHLTRFFVSYGVQKEIGNEDAVYVMERVKANSCKRNSARDRELCINILRWITRNGEEVDAEFKDQLLVPIQTDGDTLEFAYCYECTYCDDTRLLKEACEEHIKIVDDGIARKTAELLGIKSLSHTLAKPEPLGFEFEQIGPHEPLTTRLKNILSEYTEGVSIFKELIQNADDAGATEVKFLIDWRANTNYQRKLFSREMQTCQGPALWAYNNAVFTDKDFENINRLAGATKLSDTNKIGRFGLGFNSVYHLTDVPSFISRHFLVMFDPHMTHMPDFIEDKTKPGIRLNFRDNKRVLRMYSDQFQTYNGIFGCNIMNGCDYNATLFRLPLRSEKAANQSLISNTVYTKERMEELIGNLKKHANSLLVFTQHVSSVSVLERIDECHDILFKIDTEGMKIIHSPEADFTVIRQNLKKGTEYLNNIHAKKRVQPEVSVYLLSSSCTTYRQGGKANSQKQEWAVSSCVSNGKALHLALSEKGRKAGLVPCGDVAVKLTRKSSLGHSLIATRGEAFCYLPLHISTDLPIHINGGFSLDASRHNIRKHVSSDLEKSVEVEWNEVLMQDVISKAYVCLLEKLLMSGILADNNDIYSLWPRMNKADEASFTEVTRGFYQRVIGDVEKYNVPRVLIQEPYIYGERFLTLDSARVLEPIIEEENPTLADCARYVLNDHFINTNNRTAVLCEDILHTIETLGRREVIDEVTITEEMLYVEHVFPKLSELECHERDEFILHILTNKRLRTKNYIQILFQQYPTIPTSPQGEYLSRPSDLVDPTAPILAELFDEEDERFPYGIKYKQSTVLDKLNKLGMARTKLDWKDVLEITESILPLYGMNKLKALQRVQNLIKYLDELHGKCTESQRSAVSIIPFLPVLGKPNKYPPPWYEASQKILAPCMLYKSEYQNLVGTVKPVLNDELPNNGGCGKVPLRIARLLKLDKTPDMQIVLEQLSNIIDYRHTSTTHTTTKEVCNGIYSFLQSNLTTKTFNYGGYNDISDSKSLKKLLSFSRPFLLVDGTFVYPKQLCLNWEQNFPPYLYRIPEILKRFIPLLKACGVKEQFEVKDLATAIQKLKTRKDGAPLKQFELDKVCDLLQKVSKMSGYYNYDELFIPDEQCILQHPNQLAYNDAPWIEIRSPDLKFIHGSISRQLALQLGVKPLRSKQLGSYSTSEGFFIGEDFGQHESLTNRLKGILNDYPFGIDIMKELVQNADDAKATLIHFIYDKRNHQAAKVFKRDWRDLHGPALCVYNDKPFTKKDIEGIQKLGVGGKRDSSETTGQYGIGFNAVYHLTDCPSFITDDTDLVVLDPHAKYVPGATRHYPGRRIKVEDLASDFPDVVPPYLGNFLKLKGATIFRLPLRTESIAQTSEISNNVCDEKTMMDLMTSFKDEMQHILLFLNHLQTVKVSKISEDGKMVSVFNVTADISDDTREQRKLFSDMTLSAAALMKEGPKMIWKIPEQTVTYKLNITDSNNMYYSWLVTQKLGFPGLTTKMDISQSCFRDQIKYVLPKGGLAVLITRSLPAYTLSKLCSKAFCFLPLPINTGLAFCINGHFALGTDRRHLWKDGSRKQWNDYIIEHVIAPAVINSLEALKCIITSRCATRSQLIEIYKSMFPNLNTVHTEWRFLAQCIYRHIWSANVQLIPVIRPIRDVTDDGRCRTSQKQTLQWFFAKDVFFDTLPLETDNNGDVESLQFILREIGFPVTALPGVIINHFGSSSLAEHYDVKCITPENVIQFLRRFTSPGSLVSSGFYNLSRILKVLNYCLKSTDVNLHDVPLCVTSDRILKIFDKDNPVYATKFASLIPQLNHKFLHEYLLSVLQDKVTSSSTLKSFGLHDLNSNLHMVLLHGWKNTRTYIEWHPSVDQQPSTQWLKTLWHFFHARQYYGETISSVKEWPVLPTTGHYLVPLSLGKTVLDLKCSSMITESVDNTIRILQMLNCPILDYDAITSTKLTTEDVFQLVKSHVANPNCRTDVLEVLYYRFNSNKTGHWLTSNDCSTLLEYFQEDISKIRQDPGYIHKLKSLPVYATIFKTLTSVQSFETCYILSSGIPSVERDTWTGRYDCTFLKEQQELSKLYKVLPIEKSTEADVYVKFILPCFEDFSDEGRIRHLEYIRDKLQPYYYGDNGNLSRLLKDLKFIPCLFDDSQLFPACEFCDHQNEVFHEFMPYDSFPTRPYDEKEWLPFLKICGLQYQVTGEQFLQFADEVMGMKDFDKDKAVSQAKLLINHLMKHPYNEDILNQISSLDFVPTQQPDIDLLTICPQRYDSEDDFSSYSEMIPCDKSNLIWTAVPILPHWAYPNTRYGQFTTTEVIRGLKIQTTPRLDSVLIHCKNLSEVVAEKNTIDFENTASQNLFCVIMKEIYDFMMKTCLQYQKTHCMCSGKTKETVCSNCTRVHAALHTVPMVVVDDGNAMVRACQIFSNCPCSMEPYLYKLPIKLGQYVDLFQLLGAQDSSSPTQFAVGLEEMYHTHGSTNLTGNELATAEDACKGLFSGLENKGSLITKQSDCVGKPGSLPYISTLYLLDSRKQLHPSTEMVFNDLGIEGKRLGEFKCAFLMELSTFELNTHPKRLIECLQEEFKPKMLSSMFREEVADLSPCNHHQPCQYQDGLTTLFSSDSFVQDVLSLMVKNNRDLTFATKRLVKNLKNVKIRCLSCLQLNVVNVQSNSVIPESRIKVPVHIRVEAETSYTLYLDHTECISGKIYGAVTKMVCKVVLLGSADVIQIDIRDLLELKVTSPVSYELQVGGHSELSLATHQPPMVGSRIPQNEVQFLDQDPGNIFYENEYVGFIQDTGSDEPMYIFAKVIQEVRLLDSESDETCPNYQRLYVVDTGKDENIVISSLHMYKIIKAENGDPLVSLERISSSTSPEKRDLDEVFSEVSEFLEAIWSDSSIPEEEYKIAIKRLYLKWHPDKNSGDEEFATEVFKHLKNELDRLENRGPISKGTRRHRSGSRRQSSSHYYSRSTGHGVKRSSGVKRSGYSNSYEYWDKEASQCFQHSHRSGDSTSLTYTDGQSTDVRVALTGPMPTEGKRWLRQARVDLFSAEKDLGGKVSSYEWVCFKCQQATEKALKGGLYAVQGHVRNPRVHCILTLASNLSGHCRSSSDLITNARSLRSLKCDHLHPRYPDMYGGSRIPNDVYTLEMATAALEHAKEIVREVDILIDEYMK
ncbi:sacsin-like [Glandiceps talaboti]